MKPVLALLVRSIPGSRTPGAFRFFALSAGEGTRVAGMIFRCPGCNQVNSVGFERPTRPEAGVWSWDGNRTAPTLTPSLVDDPARGGCGWHGLLTAGVWTPSS